MIHAKMPRGPQNISAKTPYVPLTYKLSDQLRIRAGRTVIESTNGTDLKLLI